MWIFTKYGFYSIVCAKRDGEGGPSKIMIRARMRRHLENLADRFPALKDAEIKTTTDTDYRYRLFLKKETWAGVLFELAQEQDYSNFKDEAARNRDAVGSRYVDALHEVWSVMYPLQKAPG